MFLLVAISLFWAVADYSAAAGSTQAQRLEARLARHPDVVVYSAQSLSLQAPGVRELACQNPDAAYRFRYDGLKLVPQAGDHYLFLPEVWSRSDGVAILLPRSDALRLEFTTASAAGSTRDPAC